MPEKKPSVFILFSFFLPSMVLSLRRRILGRGAFPRLIVLSTAQRVRGVGGYNKGAGIRYHIPTETFTQNNTAMEKSMKKKEGETEKGNKLQGYKNT